MGSPKFTLDRTMESIQPHLGYLPFRRHQCPFADDFHDKIGDMIYRFEHFPKNVFVSCSVPQPDHFMYLDTVIAREVNYPLDGSYEKVVSFRKLFMIRRKGGRGFFINWLVQNSVFHPSTPHGSKKPYFFSLKESLVYYIENDDDYRQHFGEFPQDFHQRFWDQVLEWVQHAFRVRQESIAGIEALNALILKNVPPPVISLPT